MNKTRAGAIAIILGLIFGLLASTSAEAEVADGWDYRSLSLNGTYQPLVGQFGGADAATDIFWYSPGTGPDSLWLGKAGARGSDSFTRISMAVSKTYTPIVGDFAGDDYDDILWYAPGAASDVLWTSVNTPARFSSRTLSISGTYRPTVLHDYKGPNRKDDILWYAPGTGKDFVWHMNEAGTATYSTVNVTINSTFQMVVGDWNADKLEDLVLYAPGSTGDHRWASKSDGSFATSSLSINGTFKPVTIAQATGDSILWWGDGTASEAYWVPSGATFKSVAVQSVADRARVTQGGIGGAIITVPDNRDGYFKGGLVSGSWYLLAGLAHDKTTQRPLVGDFDDDDYIDIVWYGAGSQADELWYNTPSAPAPGRSMGAGQQARATPIIER